MNAAFPRRLVLLACACVALGKPLAAAGAEAPTEAGPDSAAALPGAGLDVYQARADYQRAVALFEAGRSTAFRHAMKSLEGYVLHPYLVYYDARSRVNHLSPDAAAAVRERLADMPLGERFHTAWLLAQARRGRWQRYRDHYVAQTRADAQCYYARALYRTGDRAEALALAPGLWRVGESQPKACDPLFEAWMATGAPSESLAWARLGLAIDNNERTLARYLLRFFRGSAEKAARAYHDGHRSPSIVRQMGRFPDTEYGHEALAHALIRYARREPGAAADLWRRYRQRLNVSAATSAHIDWQLELALARGGEFPQAAERPAARPSAIRNGMAEASVAHLRWDSAAQWIGAMSEANGRTHRWRYWLARASLEGDDAERGQALLTELAQERDYYGFLAAQRLGAAPALNEHPTGANAEAQAAVRRHPAVERMVELYAVGDAVNARREWNRVYDELSTEERGALVELAAEIGWVGQAIIGASRAELTDRLALRFPTPFPHIFRRYAFEANLPLAFVFAVSRQESAFNPKAVSRAGARGLMQLMPATARATARQARLPQPSTAALFDPDTNVRLGAHHLAHLMQRYDGHRALVAAAYNAGSARVNRWLKERGGLPTDVWIETIPFAETRGYVKSVLAFSHVYAHRMGEPAQMLREHERTVP